MFRDALKELRYHPGRIVATLVAIAISVGFMSAVSIFITTQGDALGRSAALTTSKADVVANLTNAKDASTSAAVRAAITRVPGVKTTEQSATSQMSLSGAKGSRFAQVFSTPGPDFRWAPLTAGSWPSKPTEIAIGQQLSERLGVGLGGQVDTGVVKLTVSGITDEPPSIFFDTAYATAGILSQGQEQAASGDGSWLVKATAGTDPADLSRRVHEALKPLVNEPDQRSYEPDGPINLVVTTGSEAQTDAVKQIAGQFDVMKYVLLVFSAIAALVGMIIIANTFTILLAQRRRQIGLLRAVGASGSQVRRRFLAEAVLLGLLGSLLGLVVGCAIAWGGALYTKATYWGLSMPWRDLLVEVIVGVVLTVLAAMLPSLRATRVAPLEALQPVATSEQTRRTSLVRAVICGLFFLGGIALSVMSLGASKDATATGPVALAVVGSVLVTIGVLFGAPLYIPLVLKVMGRIFGLFGATSKLAAANAVRNPRRASATATALMLACGLIVTLQVGTATAEKTVLAKIAESYPVDITVSSNGSSTSERHHRGEPVEPTTPTTNRTLTATELAKLRALPNVKQQATLLGGTVAEKETSSSGTMQIVAPTEESRKVTDVIPAIGDDQVLTGTMIKRGTKITLTGRGHTVTLTSLPTKALQPGFAMVSQATLDKLVATPTAQLQWMKVANADDLGTTMTPLMTLVRSNPSLDLGGSAVSSYMITKVLNILLLVTMGLLGAAVLIALIGVSNTLGLSVIERARESALLRALGMQRTSLRLMLLVEALMLALAGVIIGVLAGSWFGWLGIRAIMQQAALDTGVRFAVNLPLTLGLIAIAVVAAALASILPGRRAANATPTEALAQD